MPIITDAELNHYQEQEEENNTLFEKNEDLKESYSKVIKFRNIFIIISIILFLLLVAGFVLKSLKPELFLNRIKLEAKGLSVVPTQEYASLVEFKENQLINPQEGSNEDEAYENDNTEENYTQESIGDKTVYAVQIGAFVNNDIGLYSESFTQFNEFQQEGFYKYSLGAFETLEEAQAFRKKVINLGFKDAFVASFQNGERVAIEDPY